jgi:predicted O-linked N-acetylglucosamine transferase (SPINDLY family)
LASSCFYWRLLFACSLCCPVFLTYPSSFLLYRTHHSFSEVFAYAHGADDGSDERNTIKRTADKFADVSAMPPDEVAALIAADGVQVLIDYDGTACTMHASTPCTLAHHAL